MRLYQFAYGTIVEISTNKRAISRTQRLGFEPRLKALETLVLPLHHRCRWSQWWELNPHILTYEVSTLPLGDTAAVGG